MKKQTAQKRRKPKQSTINTKNKKTTYKVRNWSEYNRSLIERGSLEFWIEQGVKVTVIKEDDKPKKKGAPIQYADSLIESILLIGQVFHQPLRQTQGLASSLFRLAGQSIKVPDFTTLSRRSGKLSITLATKTKRKTIAILDSTGLKIYGEGEWKVRKHGYSKRRTWVKLHVSIDKDGEIRAGVLTDNATDDAQAGIALLGQQKNLGDQIEETEADGAYDKSKFYHACEQAAVSRVVIPPRRGAKIWKHGNSKGPPHPRDENLRAVRKHGRAKWKRDSGYHKRSLVETTMYRRKKIFGDTLRSRKTENQRTEVMVSLKALNIMLHHGRPYSYAVT